MSQQATPRGRLRALARFGVAATLPWLVMLISLACTLFAWWFLQAEIRETARISFDSQVATALNDIHDRFRAYEQVLRGAVGLFGSGPVSRQDWREYVTGLQLEESFPGIQAIGYAEVVPADQIAAHVQKIREEGFPAYRPEGARALYAPIVYLEPFAGRNSRAFGYDMLSEPIRRAAMEQAVDTGAATLSGKVTLIQEMEQSERQAGTLLYLPVYRRGTPHQTKAQRQAALQGYVHAALRMDDLMSHGVRHQDPNLNLEIFDGNNPAPHSLLYDSDGKLHFFAGDYQTAFRKTAELTVAGRPWTLDFTATKTYAAQFGSDRPPLVLTGGSVISLLLFGMTLALASTRVRAEERVQAMTAQLREHESQLNGIIETAMDAIITIDERQNIVLFNSAAERMFRCAARAAIGASVEGFIPERFRKTHRQHVEHFGRTGITARSIGTDLALYGLRADGEEFPIDASISQLERNGNKFYTVVLRDVTQRRRVEAALVAANEFNLEVLSSINEGLVVYDRTLRVVAWNRFLEEFAGVPRQQAMGKQIYEIFPSLRSDDVDHYLQRALGGETVVEKQFRPLIRGTTEYLLPDSEPPDALRLAWTLSSFAPHKNDAGEVVGVIVTMLDVTQLKRSQDLQAQYGERLRDLSSHLESVREAERTRIAREIHDELAATLTGIKMDLSAAPDLIREDAAELEQRLRKSAQLVDGAVQTTRRIINDLRPSILDNLGVWAAIEWQAQEIAKRAGIDCEVAFDPAVETTDLAPARGTALFRIIQESLGNVLRHARASRVRVHAYADNCAVIVEVIDDGRGVEEAELTKTGHWGVMGMYERAKAHGGEVKVTGAPGRGTTVTVRIPLGD